MLNVQPMVKLCIVQLEDFQLRHKPRTKMMFENLIQQRRHTNDASTSISNNGVKMPFEKKSSDRTKMKRV
jgi:hypothetical protein